MTLSDRPPFDPVRACFWLVALVIGVHGAVVLMGAGLCVYFGATIVGNPEIMCDPKGRLSDLLAGALAAALAFSGGFVRGRNGKPPDDPPPPTDPKG
jgi:hypothetical protein